MDFGGNAKVDANALAVSEMHWAVESQNEAVGFGNEAVERTSVP